MMKYLFAFLLLMTPVFAHDYTLGDLKIHHPWARATPNSAKVAGGFMKITNTGKITDRLLSGVVSFASRAEVHEMSHDNGVMRMRELPKGLEIKPGETVELKPGSFHMMFMDLSTGLKEGEKQKGTLLFEKAGKLDVDFKIEAIGAQVGKNEHVH
jgi:periplasmic copper chaperone A